MEQRFFMTQKELSIYDFIIKVEERRISQLKASELLNISDRHFRRLLKAYEKEGPTGLISKKIGKPSNNRLPAKLHEETMQLVKSHYSDFGPTLVKEKLYENHKIKVSVETLRQWMIKAELWNRKRRKRLTIHQSRLRRSFEG